MLKEITTKLGEMEAALNALKAEISYASTIEDVKEKAFMHREKVFRAMQKLRLPADELEMLVDEKHWPFPTYGDFKNLRD